LSLSELMSCRNEMRSVAMCKGICLIDCYVLIIAVGGSVSTGECATLSTVLEWAIFGYSVLWFIATHPCTPLIELPHHLVCSLFEILDHGSVTLPDEFVHLVYSMTVLFSVLFPYSVVDPCIFWH